MHKDRKRIPNGKSRLPARSGAAILLAGLLLLLLAACQAQPSSAGQPAASLPTETESPPTALPPTEVPPTEVPPTEIPPTEVSEAAMPPAGPPPDHAAIQAAWEASPHGNTYDFGKGPNTYCSRCHSPQNWDPEATTGQAPNCVTCKFPTDEEIRIATTMDFVEEEDWVGITCETCHRVDDGLLQAELAWFNPLTETHEPVNSPNELCGKCHADTKGVSATGGRGVEHAIVLGGSAHLDWAGALPQVPRPKYCSDCHDPHSTVPKQCLDCHEDVLESETHMKGQQEAHQNVTCMACHDASGLQVGPHPDEAEGGKWVTLLASVSRSGEMTTEYLHSHSIQWQVDCTRCHAEDNPWELPVLTADGVPPEPASD